MCLLFFGRYWCVCLGSQATRKKNFICGYADQWFWIRGGVKYIQHTVGRSPSHLELASYLLYDYLKIVTVSNLGDRAQIK